MRLGLFLADIRQSDGGIFQYSVYLLKMLLKCDDITHITVFMNKCQETEVTSLIKESLNTRVVVCQRNRIHSFLRRIADFWITRYYMREHPSSLFIKLYIFFHPDRRFFNRFKLDVLHVPRQHSPVYRLNYPVVISMHDVQHLHFPEYFTPLQRIHKSIRYHISMEEADGIVVSFSHVKDDLGKFFCHARDKVNVCSVPLSDDWISKKETGGEELTGKYNLQKSFILTPSATWEHKNHAAVLEALFLLKKQGMKVQWIATGHKTPYYSTIARKISELELEDQVTFTGVVRDADLRGLYSLTSLVVIPTKYEAGSGPLFEAIRYNVPVICSDVTSLPGTIGDREFVFDPDNYAMIAGMIAKGLTDKAFIERNRRNSEKRLKFYTEMNYSESYVNAYKWAIQNHLLNKTYA